MLNITSIKNPRIINLQKLEKARERKIQNLFVIEGLKELTMAVVGGYEIKSIFFCASIVSANEIIIITKKNNKIELIEISEDVFQKLAYRESYGGVIATAVPQKHLLNNIKLSSIPLIIILESVEKPGNLGAILRTADAANVDAVIVCDGQTDVYNPNVVRSSLGCVFTTPIAVASSDETINWAKQNNIKIYATALTASKAYHTINYLEPSAIVMGTESTGLSDVWLKNSTQNIIIPMSGKIDSMNVSNATAIVVFEAKRQRRS
ncbi:MAG: rRNA methyltransferase [Bacteroidetes bacterium RIFCSPLOWO2_12_FULL_31_6]|nr:MAG: rRNA methyltransferase [Bacteroidetes bacterium RIFCSPLOWO2_12_FULL_31_6]